MFYGKISLKSYCISKIKQIFNQKLLFCEIRACDSNSLCLEAPSLGVFHDAFGRSKSSYNF